MVNQETYKMELEIELKRVELEIKEKELEIHKNNMEAVKTKEKIEAQFPEHRIESHIENIILGKSPSAGYVMTPVFSDNLMVIGALAYKNYCLEEEKSTLCSLKEDLVDKMSRETICGLPIE